MTHTDHLVRAITFAPRSNDGPCECTCGWEGAASAFERHRRDASAQPHKGWASRNDLAYLPGGDFNGTYREERAG